MPLNLLGLAAIGIFGFVNQGIWLLGLGLEAAYLMMLASNARFQKVVNGQWMMQSRPSEKPAPALTSEDLLGRLSLESRERFARLQQQCREILKLHEGPESAASMADVKSDSLNQMLAIYARMLNLRERIRETLAKTQRKDLASDIEALTEKISKAPETSSLRRALQGTMEIQQARLQNLDKSVENLKYTETELDRIEKQVSLIAEEAAVSKSPEQISMSLDGVVSSIQQTNKWMTDNSSILDMVSAPTTATDLLNAPAIEKPPPLRRTVRN